MQVRDIMRSKGNAAALYTVALDTPLGAALGMMAMHDVGSLVVIHNGALAGLLTFREVLRSVAAHTDNFTQVPVREIMNPHPVTCSLDTELDALRYMMLEKHARYMPVMDKGLVQGVLSFYDVAKSVVDSQSFENKMLKAYIRDWPVEGLAEGDGPT